MQAQAGAACSGSTGTSPRAAKYASDIFPTVAIQDKKNLALVGISNYFFPNPAAVQNLAHSYDFECASLSGPHNAYTGENPYRQFFRLTKIG